MRVSCERRHAPIGDDDSDENDGDCDRRAEASAPVVIEANIADAVEAMVEGDEEERDIDGDKPRVAEKALLDDFKRKARGSAHFGSEVLYPEMHDEQHQQGGAGDALQKPVNCAGRHLLAFVSLEQQATENTEVTERIVFLGVLCDLCGAIHECCKIP